MTDNKAVTRRIRTAAPVVLHAGGTEIALRNAAMHAELAKAMIHIVELKAPAAGSAVHMLVDLCLYMPLLKLSERQQGSLALGTKLNAADSCRYEAGFDVDILSPMRELRWMEAGVAASWTHTVGADVALDAARGDPMRMLVLFCADDFDSAQSAGNRLSAALAKLADARSKFADIASAFRELTLPTDACQNSHKALLYYRGVDVVKGWHSRIADPNAFLGAIDTGVAEPKRRIEADVDIADFCAEQLYDAWLGLAPALDVPSGEAAGEPGDAVADEYLCAERLMGLWFGSARRLAR